MPHVYAHAVELATTVLTVAGMGYYLAALVAGYVYLARLARSAGEMEEARKFYREALAVEGASGMAKEAAEKESKAIPQQDQEI